VAQVVKYLPNNGEGLSSNPNNDKKKKKEEEFFENIASLPSVTVSAGKKCDSFLFIFWR
jgi:hypothetical protein